VVGRSANTARIAKALPEANLARQTDAGERATEKCWFGRGSTARASHAYAKYRKIVNCMCD